MLAIKSMTNIVIFVYRVLVAGGVGQEKFLALISPAIERFLMGEFR